ncbi:hypothetical protein BDQ17DRAFT_1328488 [Cyathus striatus]|nr:hypothetical protein BDQ17DRAFT_1328488 [Cyathus striatus]
MNNAAPMKIGNTKRNLCCNLSSYIRWKMVTTFSIEFCNVCLHIYTQEFSNNTMVDGMKPAYVVVLCILPSPMYSKGTDRLDGDKVEWTGRVRPSDFPSKKFEAKKPPARELRARGAEKKASIYVVKRRTKMGSMSVKIGGSEFDREDSMTTLQRSYTPDVVAPSNVHATDQNHGLLPRLLGLKKDTDDDDTAPLITEHTDPLPPESKSDKFIDILVALNAGKLPSQEQLSRIFRYVLKSELLCDDGPTSRIGRKVIGDAREVVQSMLQLGMEKNDDNKIQKGVPISVDINTSSPSDASRTALNAAEAVAPKLRQEAPSGREIASDSEILLSCIKTLLRSALTSSVFRLLIIDTLDVARQLVVHAAVDVESAAEVVREAAKDVEKKARSENVEIGLKGIKDKGKEVASDVIDGGRKVREEWEGTTDDLERDMKQKLVKRIQGMMVRVQRDPASRQALHAILLLVRKYSEIASKMSVTIAATAADAASAEPENYPPHPYPPTSSEPVVDIDVTSSSLDTALKDMKVFIERLAKGKNINPLWSAFKQVIQDISEIPAEIVETVEEKSEEKMAEVQETEKEEKSSGTNDILKARPPGTATENKKKGKKKGKKIPLTKSPAKEPEAPEPSAWGNNVLSSEIVQPRAHNGPGSQPRAHNGPEKPLNDKDFPPLPNQKGAFAPEEDAREGINPYRAYFTDVGAYLERALSEPGWAASDKGANSLELLVNMSSDLLDVTGEAVGEALAEMTVEGSENAKDQDLNLKQRFGRDMQALLNEIDRFAMAVESDRATMQFVRALERLSVDFGELFSVAPAEGKKKARAASMRGGLLGFGTTWTQWLSWGLPKIIQMIPPNWIPIPTMEVKSPTVDGALDALWLRDSASWKGDANAGIKGELVPDQITLRDWTEVQVDMPSADPHGRSERVIRTTSRIRAHMDGIRASVRGMGYYLDEGILSVNLGTKSRRGVGLDIELEVDSSTESLENAGIPTGCSTDHDSDDWSPNIDVQRTVASSSATLGNGGTRRVPVSQTPLGPALQEPVEPLFRVINVKLDLDGMGIHLDQTYRRTCSGAYHAHAVEEKIRSGLGWFAVGVGRLLAESKERRKQRRVAQRDSIKYREPIWNMAQIEDEIEDETTTDLISDWWSALVEKGPEAFGKGVIYTSVTTTQQPGPGPVMNPIVSPEEMETFDLTQEDYTFRRPSPEEMDRMQHEEETVVAVGTGAQLFPGKIGPSGQSNGEESEPPLSDRVKNAVKTGAEGITKGIDNAKAKIQDGAEGLQGIRIEKISESEWNCPEMAGEVPCLTWSGFR